MRVGNVGNLGELGPFFSDVQTRGMQLNVVAYNDLISSVGSRGDWQGSLYALRHLWYAGVNPNLITYFTALFVCGTGGAPQETIYMVFNWFQTDLRMELERERDQQLRRLSHRAAVEVKTWTRHWADAGWEASAERLFTALQTGGCEGAYMVTLPVAQIRNSHDSVKCRFQDGRDLQQMIEDLEVQRIRSRDFVLKGFRMDNQNWSLCNRRLVVLKKYQDNHPDQVVQVQLQVFPAWAIWEKVIPSWTSLRDPLDNGRQVRIR